jgi:hypothetical protein
MSTNPPKRQVSKVVTRGSDRTVDDLVISASRPGEPIPKAVAFLETHLA